MVVAILGKAEADRHDVEEGRLRQRNARTAEIVPDMEGQLVDTRSESGALQNGTVNAPVRVGHAFRQHRLVADARQCQREAGGRAAGARIQDMRRQPSRHRPLLARGETLACFCRHGKGGDSFRPIFRRGFPRCPGPQGPPSRFVALLRFFLAWETMAW